VHDPGSAADVFVATDDGVYHHSDVLGIWTRYSNFLPRAICTDIGINYALNTLFVSTYGRGCWFSATGLVATEPSAGVGQPYLSAFPNPSRGEWVLRYDLAGGDQGTLRLYHLDGRQLAERVLDQPSGELRELAGDLPQGMYLLRLDAPAGMRCIRLVIE
jgi:hypothetical protein